MQKGFVVHVVIANDQGLVLILRRSKQSDVLPEYWDIPGGTLEDGEDPAVGAIREVKEETGLEITNPQLFFQKSNIDVAKDKQFVTLIFQAKSAVETIKLDPIEHESFIWVEPSRVGEYETVEYLPDCLQAYIQLKMGSTN